MRRVCSPRLDEPGLVRQDDELHAVSLPEFGEQPGDVGLHGGLSDGEAVCDLDVGAAGGDFGEDLLFACGQYVECRMRVGRRLRRVRVLPDKPAGHLGGEQDVAADN